MHNVDRGYLQDVVHGRAQTQFKLSCSNSIGAFNIICTRYGHLNDLLQLSFTTVGIFFLFRQCFITAFALRARSAHLES